MQSACDYVKGAAAWLSGRAPPTHDDTEQTIGEVRARIRKTLAFVDSLPAVAYADAGAQRIRIAWADGKSLHGRDYLLQITIPNVYFHLMAAYAILRHNGVDIGKGDYLRPIRWIEQGPSQCGPAIA